jgi:hypothetical protein
LALTSSHTSETFGAFDEMDLSKQQRVPEFAAPAYISRHSPQVPAPTYAVPTPPIHRSAYVKLRIKKLETLAKPCTTIYAYTNAVEEPSQHALAFLSL